MNLSELVHRDFLFKDDGTHCLSRVFCTGNMHGPKEHFRLCAQVVFSKTGEASLHDYWMRGDIFLEPHPGVSDAYCPIFLTDLADMVKDFKRHVLNHIKDINEKRMGANEHNKSLTG